MSDVLMKEIWDYYKEINDIMSKSNRKVQMLNDFANQLQKTFNGFAKSIENTTDKFNKEILRDSQGENERLLSSYQLFSTTLIKISEAYRKVATKLKNEVMDPYNLFIENYKDTNKNIIKKSNDILSDMDKQKNLLAKCQQQYYQSCQKSDKCREDIEKAVQKIEKGGKNNDLVKANEVSLKMGIIVDQHQREYKQAISKQNAKWKTFNKQFQNLCAMFEYNQESRLSFSKSTINNACRVFLEFNQTINVDIDKRAREAEEKLKTSKKTTLIQTIGKGKLKDFLNSDIKEHFLTLQESKKKVSVKKEQKSDKKGAFESDRNEMEKLLNIWFNSEHVKPSQELDKIRLSIISSEQHSLQFIDLLFHKITKMPSFYVKIEEDYFNELVNIFILITRSFEDEDKYADYLYKMMTVSMRIMKLKKEKAGQLRELLCAAFGKDNKIFLSEKMWLRILQILKKNNQRKKQQTESKLALFAKGFNNFVGIKQQEEDQFQFVQEMTSLMSALSVPTQFSLPFLKKLLEDQREAFDFLKSSLETKQDIQLRQKLTESKQIRLQKQNRQLFIMGNKLTSIYCIKLIAKKGYLTLESINLRLVCKKLINIHKLIIFNMDIPHKWIRIVDAKVIDYISMKTTVACNSVPSATEEIISLDVNRSLHVHTDYLNPTLLHTLLRTFAYYNKNINYCQGMNYLAGYLFIKTKQEEQAYRIFERLMLDKFSELFTNEFEVLKLKMYQFERLLSIYIPALADHFKKHSISSECYIVSWIITLYSATYQYTLNSYLVDVLWDRFIVWGWREFFKFTLWIFNIIKQDLLELSFDRALHYLGELTRTELFTSSKEQLVAKKKIDVKMIHHQLDQYHVTNSLLERLKKEYEVSQATGKK